MGAAMAVGRPRDFDADEALERAMRVFWQKGYEGASLADLTEAMGINRPSLYAAFGNKEALFEKALQRYADGPGGYSRAALAAPSAREVAARMLQGAVDIQSDPRAPKGCLMVHSGLASGTEAEPVRKFAIARRREGETALRKRFERAKAEGDLAAESDPAALARFISAVIYGIAVQAASGASRKDLKTIADQAMRAWPSA
jgi:AcrR family transcriptional regulator